MTTRKKTAKASEPSRQSRRKIKDSTLSEEQASRVKGGATTEIASGSGEVSQVWIDIDRTTLIP